MSEPTPPVDKGLHTSLIKQRLPAWISHCAAGDIRRLNAGLAPGRIPPGPPPAWLATAKPALVNALHASQARSRASSQALAKTLKPLKAPTEFAQPLLVEALRTRFGQTVDVNKNALFHLHYRQATEQHTLLQAALQNFEGNEDFSEESLGETSALAPVGALETEFYGKVYAGSQSARHRYREKLTIPPQDFATLCRTLDVGRQYQEHLKQVFDAPDSAPRVRAQMIQARKDLLAVRLHTARIRQEVSEPFYKTLLQLLAGVDRPLLGGRPLGYTQLSVLGCPVGEVVLIGPGGAADSDMAIELGWVTSQFPGMSALNRALSPASGRFVAWIPGAPLYPVKEYPSLEAFEKDLAIHLRSRAYQQLFASRVPQGDAPAFLKRLKDKLFTYKWNSSKGLMEQVYDEQISLNLRETPITGELFGALYEKHVQRLKDNALKLAVPTAEADRQAARERREHWLSIGLNVLNVAAFIVPGLGEVMLAVTAIQLGMEVYHGIESWKQGDLDAAWAHLESVALNVAFMATLAGAGAMASRAPVIQVSKWVDGLVPVKLPNGEARLWKPDLQPYRSKVVLDPTLKPNAQGQYEVGGKTYVRMGDGVYEKGFDTQLKKWRIKHPDNPMAYQPELHTNHAGAWRSIHEQPRDWDRLTLLRRLGHDTLGFPDETLKTIGDISAVPDEVLRNVHIDGLPMPAQLVDALRLFRGEPPVNPLAPPLPDSEWLQRRFPTLSRAAMREVLARISPKERNLMRTSGRVPGRLDNLARTYIQQARVSRALAGVHRETLASPDSDRLILHSLERQAGWPGGVRLEVRADSVAGALLDSIGPEAATVRRYLVKVGDTFQAFNEGGVPLNRAVPGTRNYFQSILHALPEPARASLGVPLVTQAAELQRKLAGFAVSNRGQMAGFLRLRPVRSRPPLRLSTGRLGYLLSGRGAGAVAQAPLVARVRDLYPNLSEEQAARFVVDRLRGGEREQQVFTLLGNRQREFDSLKATLDEWVRAVPEHQEAARNLLVCWRQNLYRGTSPHARLNLGWEPRLPALAADFSHVRELRVRGAALLGEDGIALFQQFPQVQRLDLQVEQSDLMGVGERLRSVPGIIELSIEGHQLNFSSGFEQTLAAMPQLERLTLNGAMARLDVSGLNRLRRLSLSGSLAQWPVGVMDLGQLESLNLSATRINTLPAAMFEGHDRLWRGLQMNWSSLAPEEFMRVFDHVHDSPAHRVDEARMVQLYCNGSLSWLRAGDKASFLYNVEVQFKRLGLSARERVTRVNALRTEFTALMEELESWQVRELRVERREVDFFYRQRAAESLLSSWREGLDARLAPDGAVAGPSSRVETGAFALDLSGGVLGDFPQLPAEGFHHVRSLNVGNTRVSESALNGFLGKFPNLHTLDLSRNNLSALPSSLMGRSQLRLLDLSHNQLTVTGTVQRQLNGLVGLQTLNLQYNRVGVLDIRSLSQLQTLNLSHTAASAWPDGALASPGLRVLDLSYSRITSLPAQVLNGDDGLRGMINLRGCRLSPAALADLQGLAQRTSSDPLLGIPRRLLTEGRTGGDPEYFPAEVAEYPDLLLALPEGPVGSTLRLTPAARLQRLDPGLTDVEAIRRIDALTGLGALEVEACLTRWSEQHKVLTRQLNAWIDIRGYREGHGWVSAFDRRRAADRLLDSWRQTLRAVPEAGYVLDLSDLCVGDFPALGKYFDHVTELNLTATKLTEQGSNAFLRAFPGTLGVTLNHNGLACLPDAVSGFSRLTRLEATHNDIRDVAQLQRQLDALTTLEHLDLSENTLEALDVTRLPRLETLDLHGNILLNWPEGVLQAPRLRTLNLHNNQIESIPHTALEQEHRMLMSQTDLSDNFLQEHEFEALRDYLLETGNGLGFSLADIDRLLDGYSSPSNGLHPELMTDAEQKAQWFRGVPADSEKHSVWDELKSDKRGIDFFYIITQLKNAKDFIDDRAELTQRVLDMLETAHEHAEFREMLFAKAEALRVEATCGNGWILLFSDLEVSLYEFKALQGITSGQEGPSLFKLARSMIRLEAVETIASAAADLKPGIDRAEVKLAYRIGLAQRLGLARQPADMLYRNLSGVKPADIEAAYAAVIAGENTPAFLEKLVLRPYWVDYLKGKYPAEFSTLAQSQEVSAEALESRHTRMDQPYQTEAMALGRQNTAEQTALAIRLSALERTALNL